MRKSRTGSAKKKRLKTRGLVRRPPPAKTLTVDELLEAGKAALDGFRVEEAIQFLGKAANLLKSGQSSSVNGRENTLVHVLEKLGEAKVSIGDQDGAKQDFKDALELLELEIDKNMEYYETQSNLHFYRGQLCMAQEALDDYKKGIVGLEICIELASNETSSEETLPNLRQKLSGAYCTIAELYLTDLCYEDNAEVECEKIVEKALHIKDHDGEPPVDALQTMASLRLSQKERQMEAIPYILRVYEKMKVGAEALASLVGLDVDTEGDVVSADDQAVELSDVDAANNLPEFEFRCQSAKLLLECAALTKMTGKDLQQQEMLVSAAISVLGSLLAQNDEVIEIWFLTGCAFASKTIAVKDAAQYYFDRTRGMLSDTKKSLEHQLIFSDGDERHEIETQLDEVDDQIEEVRLKLKEIGSEGENAMEE